jgi:PAS domain S-box-containing protein
MEAARPPSALARRLLTVLATAAAGLLVAYLIGAEGAHAKNILSDVSLAIVFLTGGLCVFGSAAGYPHDPRRALGVFLVLCGLLHVGFLVHVVIWPESIPFGGSGYANLLFLIPGLLVLSTLRGECGRHLRPEEHHEVVADIVLGSVALGGIVFLLIHPPVTHAGSAVDLSTVVFALAVVAPVAWGALAAWAPSRAHALLFASWAAIAAGAIEFGFQWIRGTYVGGQPLIDLPVGLGGLALAAILVVSSPGSRHAERTEAHRILLPVLTVSAVTAACGTLALTAGMETADRITPVESAIMVGALAAAVAVRIFLNQVRTTRATSQVAEALEAKDETLRETGLTLQQLREVYESLTASEARLRLLFDVAVDGIVELDADGVVRRANEAFCTMTGLPQEEILGHRWTDIAERVEGGGASLAGLPETGQAVLRREGNEVHLAGRSSDLPGPESGRLLVIRDVSADKVAEMTIRQLFKFLQDRDEDRSRLLQRTNAAIEAERNRIARDLHDGPVQGISAASLSLEAVLLMLRTGDVEGGMEMLTKIREEIAMETDNLRRLMSDLRPPVLEERGLIPALRDTLARFGRDFGVTTQFHARALVDVPADLETLAYRIVQEALTNAAKHAHPTDVKVSVEAEAGQLRVEIIDNGRGFEPERAREFLRVGRVGLASMRERTELASGTFMVRSSPGSGTTVVATLPLDLTAPRTTGTEAVIR